MNTNIIGQQAAALYKNTANIASGGVSSGNQDKVSFGSMVRAGVEEIIQTQKKSEQLSADAVVGKANIADVVQAVTEAEVVVQTAKAVRDRVVGAYQEIMRMPI